MRNYRRSEARARAREDRPISIAQALHGDPTGEAAERAARYAGLLSIARGPVGFSITIQAKDRWDDARPIIADVKAIEGRRYDPAQRVWFVPIEQGALVEILAEQYGAEIADVAPVDAVSVARLREMERYIAALEAELALHSSCVVPVAAARDRMMSQARRMVTA